MIYLYLEALIEDAEPQLNNLSKYGCSVPFYFRCNYLLKISI